MSTASLSDEQIRRHLWDGLRTWASRPDHLNGYSLSGCEAIGSGLSGDARRVELDAASQVLWQWATSGLLHLFKASIGDAGNIQYKPTKFGYQILQENETPTLTPYDPQGYIRDLDQSVGGLDPIIVTYIDQAMRCFHAQAYLAAMVMLGAASEQAILLVMSKFAWGRRPKDRESIGPKFEQMLTEIRAWPKERQNGVKAVTRQDWDHRLEQGFNIIRVSRNEAGHPELVRDLDQREVLGYFLLFESYTRTAYGFMAALDQWAQNVERPEVPGGNACL